MSAAFKFAFIGRKKNVLASFRFSMHEKGGLISFFLSSSAVNDLRFSQPGNKLFFLMLNKQTVFKLDPVVLKKVVEIKFLWKSTFFVDNSFRDNPFWRLKVDSFCALSLPIFRDDLKQCHLSQQKEIVWFLAFKGFTQSLHCHTVRQAQLNLCYQKS